jgi:hypothetical protein
MPRQDVHPLAYLATPSRDPLPPPDGWRPRRPARLVLLPFAALAAAVAGLVFVVLLPICGIASIASAVAQSSWDLVRETLGGVRHRTASRG